MPFVSTGEVVQKNKLTDNYYFGTVEVNEDPDKLFRVKVRVLAVFGSKVPSEDLPWATPMRPSGLGAVGSAGTYAVPRVGSRVMIKFYRGNVYTPMYVACPLTVAEKSSDFEVNYPNRYGFVDTLGNKVIMDLTEGSGEVRVYHHSGTQMFIQNDGTLNIYSANGINMEAGGDINIKAGGTITTDGSSQSHQSGSAATAERGVM